MKEITIKLTDKEYSQYVKKGQSEYHKRMKKAIEDEEYAKKRLYRKYLARGFFSWFCRSKKHWTLP